MFSVSELSVLLRNPWCKTCRSLIIKYILKFYRKHKDWNSKPEPWDKVLMGSINTGAPARICRTIVNQALRTLEELKPSDQRLSQRRLNLNFRLGRWKLELEGQRHNWTSRLESWTKALE